MLIQLQPAFVLHRRPYRESSMLIEFLTQDYGRITVVGRGARNLKNMSTALLQPFVAVLLSAYGKHDLLSLRGVELNEQSPFCRYQASANLVCGFYLNELLVYLLPKQDPNQELFALYHQSLLQLCNANEQECERILRVFEKNLLSFLGYGLSLPYRADFLPDQEYVFTLEAGFTPRHPVHRGNKYIFSGASINALIAEDFRDPQVLLEAKRLLRFILSLLLGGRKIHSRRLLTEE